MRKKIYLFILGAIPLIMYSQVGINITTPKATLDINGSLQLTKELYVGGNAYTKGDAGNAGDILTSQGIGKAPTWKSLPNMNIPTIIYSMAEIYSAKPTIAANVLYKVILPSDNLDSNFIESIDSKTLNIKKAGTYLITYNMSVSILGTPTDGTLVTYLLTNGEYARLAKNSAYVDAPKPISINSTGVLQLEANTKLNFCVAHTRNYNLDQYAITITFISEKR